MTVPFTVRPSSTGRASFCEVLFPSKPADAILAELKAADFTWCKYRDGVKGTGGVWWGKRDKLPARYKTQKLPDVTTPCDKCGSSGPLHKVKYESDSGIGSMEVCAKCDEPVQIAKPPAIPEPPAKPIAPKVSEPPLKQESPPQAQETPPAPAVEEVLEIEEPAVKPCALKVRRTFGDITAGWSVVHVGSNKALGKQFTNIASEEDAARLMAAVLPLADWTLPLEKLVKLPGLREKLAEAAVTEPPAPEVKPVTQSEPKDKGKPEPGKVYSLTGGKGQPAISNGNTWAESEVKPPEVKKPEEPKGMAPAEFIAALQSGDRGAVLQDAKPEPAACAPAKVDHAAKLRELMRR